MSNDCSTVYGVLHIVGDIFPLAYMYSCIVGNTIVVLVYDEKNWWNHDVQIARAAVAQFAGTAAKTPTDVSQYALHGVLSSYTTQIQHMIMSPLLVFRWEVGIPQSPLSDHPHMHCRGKVHMWHFVSTCSLSVVLTSLLCSGVETNILCTTGSLLDINWYAPWKPSIMNLLLVLVTIKPKIKSWRPVCNW